MNARQYLVDKEKILLSYIKGSFPLIQINSSEHDRMIDWIIDVFNNEIKDIGSYNWGLYIYDSAEGLQEVKVINGNVSFNTIPGTVEIEGALSDFFKKKSYSILVMKNLHLFLDTYRKPRLIDILFKIYFYGIRNQIYLINIGEGQIPEELRHYFVVIDIPLPDEFLIEDIVYNLAHTYMNRHIDKKEMKEIVSLCKGMTFVEINNVVIFSLLHTGGINTSILKSEKAKSVKKSGLLEWIEDVPSMKEIGGLDNLKRWLMKVGNVFLNYDKALKYGIQPQKGCLFIGVPGTGKTLCAKAIASMFKVPLFRLDVSRLYSSLVGETERNVRSVIKQIDAMSPCVVLIDEIEKSFAGYHSSSFSDAGVTARLLGSFLYYFQEKKSLSYFVCTSNDISLLPVEFLRKGRFDEIWYISLPSLRERMEIWKIHLEKVGRKYEYETIKKLAVHTKGFTGAEIESIIQETLCHSFFEQREPTLDDFISTINSTVPLSKREGEKIAKLEEWARINNIRIANRKEEEKEVKIQLKRLIQ